MKSSTTDTTDTTDTIYIFYTFNNNTHNTILDIKRYFRKKEDALNYYKEFGITQYSHSDIGIFSIQENADFDKQTEIDPEIPLKNMKLYRECVREIRRKFELNK